jgi:hypothetical protein
MELSCISPNQNRTPILGLRKTLAPKKEASKVSFDPYNCPLKIQESIGTDLPKAGSHLGVWGFIPSHFLTL